MLHEQNLLNIYMCMDKISHVDSSFVRCKAKKELWLVILFKLALWRTSHIYSTVYSKKQNKEKL